MVPSITQTATVILIEDPTINQLHSCQHPYHQLTCEIDLILEHSLVLLLCAVGGRDFTLQFTIDAIRKLYIVINMFVTNMTIHASESACVIAPRKVTSKYIKGCPMITIRCLRIKISICILGSPAPFLSQDTLRRSVKIGMYVCISQTEVFFHDLNVLLRISPTDAEVVAQLPLCLL